MKYTTLNISLYEILNLVHCNTTCPPLYRQLPQYTNVSESRLTPSYNLSLVMFNNFKAKNMTWG